MARKDAERLGPYLEQLRKLPFVQRAVGVAPHHVSADAALELVTPRRKVRFAVEVKGSHLTTEAVEGFVARHRHADLGARWMLLAPAIGATAGARLAEAGVDFVDRDGNCFVHLDDDYVARIQLRERKEHRAPAAKGLRAPGYQALFALLTQPALMHATVRALGEAAGVSRETAHVVRPRLVEQGFAVEERAGFAWVPHRLRDAFELWSAGYGTVLRPALLVGTYRTADATPEALEKRIAPILREHHQPFVWGGGAAAFRLDRYYRGPRTAIHVEQPGKDLPRWLRAVPDAQGPLVVLRAFGPAATHAGKAGTAHPLLVYAELLAEGDERARDAAGELLKKHAPYVVEARGSAR